MADQPFLMSWIVRITALTCLSSQTSVDALSMTLFNSPASGALNWMTSPSGSSNCWSENSMIPSGQRYYMVCSITSTTLPNNWLRLPFIQKSAANLVYVKVTFAVRACSSYPNPEAVKQCNQYISLYYYEAGSDVASSTSNGTVYPLWRDYTMTGKLVPDTPWVSSVIYDTKTVTLPALSQQGFYLAFQDTGSCAAIANISVYYNACQNTTRLLANFPETATSSSIYLFVTVNGTCVPNASKVKAASPILLCMGDGSWQMSSSLSTNLADLSCQCNPGYQASGDLASCTPCAPNYYKDSTMSTCAGCPAMSNSSGYGNTVCTCMSGYYRAAADPTSSPCTSIPSKPTSSVAFAINSSAIQLMWQSPATTGGREDWYYTVKVMPSAPFGPAYPASFCSQNGNSGVVGSTYTVNNLSPTTTYNFLICACNGVSELSTHANCDNVSGNTLKENATNTPIFLPTRSTPFASNSTPIMAGVISGTTVPTMGAQSTTLVIGVTVGLAVLICMAVLGVLVVYTTRNGRVGKMACFQKKKHFSDADSLQFNGGYSNADSPVLINSPLGSPANGACADSITTSADSSFAFAMSPTAKAKSTLPLGAACDANCATKGQTAHNGSILAVNPAAQSSLGRACVAAAPAQSVSAASSHNTLPLGFTSPSETSNKDMSRMRVPTNGPFKLQTAPVGNKSVENAAGAVSAQPFTISSHVNVTEPRASTYTDLVLMAREIPVQNIVVEKVIGCGEFGEVCKGRMTLRLPNGATVDRFVAVKTLKASASDASRAEFLSEASIMCMFDHENILRLEGVVTRSHPLMIVSEFMENGSLDSFLHANDCKLGTYKLVQMLQGVASGMEYLATKNYVHRDLAARNILVNKRLICKIGDFGLSRQTALLNDASSYCCYMTRGGKIPVRWTAPEAILYRKFTSESDVWSFGILMWEVLSYGIRPYWDWSNNDVMRLVDCGYRLPPPYCCPEVAYNLMLRCWQIDRHARPSFQTIYVTISSWLQNPDQLKQALPYIPSLYKIPDDFEPSTVTTAQQQAREIAQSGHNVAAVALVSDAVQLPLSIREWLQLLGLLCYRSCFDNSRVLDMHSALSLTLADLAQLGVDNAAHQKRMLSSLQGLQLFRKYYRLQKALVPPAAQKEQNCKAPATATTTTTTTTPQSAGHINFSFAHSPGNTASTDDSTAGTEEPDCSSSAENSSSMSELDAKLEQVSSSIASASINASHNASKLSFGIQLVEMNGESLV